jgi:hypothetical protein
MQESRSKAENEPLTLSKNWAAAIIVFAAWDALLLLFVAWAFRYSTASRRPPLLPHC